MFAIVGPLAAKRLLVITFDQRVVVGAFGCARGDLLIR